MISILLKCIFYSTPKELVFTEEERMLFEQITTFIKEGKTIPSELNFSSFRLLQYLSKKYDFVFHGSNHLDIEEFKPREQTLFDNRPTKAIFASSDPIWSMFYAVFDRSKQVGGFRNGCYVYKKNKYHFYSLNEETMLNQPWISGKIYILPRNAFTRSNHNKIHFDEWVCQEPVKALSYLSIEPDDFYFKRQVSTHKNGESPIKTWLLYKWRTRK